MTTFFSHQLQILTCTFNLFVSKSNAVKSTIQATLRQLFSIIFTVFNQKCREAMHEDECLLFEGSQRKKSYINSTDKFTIAARLRNVEHEPIFRVIIDVIGTLTLQLTQPDAITTSGGKQPLVQKQYAWNLQPSAASRAVILDILCLALAQTQDLFQFFPTSILKIFDNEIVPMLEH